MNDDKWQVTIDHMLQENERALQDLLAEIKEYENSIGLNAFIETIRQEDERILASIMSVIDSR